MMQLSERPGIGVELNDEVAKSLLWHGDTYSTESVVSLRAAPSRDIADTDIQA